jgi:hypothetical protein
MSSSCSEAVFIMLIMFSMNVLNTKVVDNFHVLNVLEFHDFRLASLGVIPFASFLSFSVYFQYRSKR